MIEFLPRNRRDRIENKAYNNVMLFTAVQQSLTQRQ